MRIAFLLLFGLSQAHAAVECTDDKCTATMPLDDAAAKLLKNHPQLEITGDVTNAQLKAVARLTWLKHLEIQCDQDCNTLSDIRPLAKLTKLEHLWIRRAPKLTDIRPLVGLSSLAELNIDRTGVTDLAPLAKLPLVDLSVEALALPSLTGLDKLVGVKKLSLRFIDVKDWKPLAALTKLERLTCDNFADGSVLAGMTEMRDLSLWGAGTLANIDGLAHMAHLREISITHAPFTDVTPLAGAAELVRLHLANTKVTSLAPLAKLSKLSMVNLEGTMVTDLSPLQASAKTIWTMTLTKGTPETQAAPFKKANPTVSISYK
jgi:Leucine-rich repeat (LRR) protein